MTNFELMESRHSVRKYLDKPIEEDKVALLQAKVDDVNKISGLHIQLFIDEPECFKINNPVYGKITGCSNYFAMVGDKSASIDIGYYGEMLVLYAQELGLNTCWIGGSYKKSLVEADESKGEKLHLIISVGYGETQGHPRKSKTPEEVSDVKADSPEWYKNGIKAALNAPTAINQQRFSFTRDGNIVTAKFGIFAYTKIDLGIVKYHFELGAGKENFEWAK